MSEPTNLPAAAKGQWSHDNAPAEADIHHTIQVRDKPGAPVRDVHTVNCPRCARGNHAPKPGDKLKCWFCHWEFKALLPKE